MRFVYKDDPLTDIASLGNACCSGCELPCRTEWPDVYWNFVDYVHSHGQEVNGEDRDLTKSFAALDRIAREEAHSGKAGQRQTRRLHRQAG